MSAGFIEQGQYVSVTGPEVEIEDNKQATIDVSQYTAPIEVTPTTGKDVMEKVTVTLDNIPVPEHVVASNTWIDKTWSGIPTSSLYGSCIWTDGENTYCSYSDSEQYVLDKTTGTWSRKTWNNLPANFDTRYIWTDGENIYFSNGTTNQYVLDKVTGTWSVKTWTGLTDFYGLFIWTDGENTYYSGGVNQYVLDKATGTWSVKTWDGIPSNLLNGQYIWTDGENIYFSSGSYQYVLDKATGTWSTKTWNGLTNFSGDYIWTDGVDIYYSKATSGSGGVNEQYVLDKATSTWSTMSWNNNVASGRFSGREIWTDEINIYFSYGSSGGTYNKILLWKKA